MAAAAALDDYGDSQGGVGDHAVLSTIGQDRADCRVQITLFFNLGIGARYTQNTYGKDLYDTLNKATGFYEFTFEKGDLDIELGEIYKLCYTILGDQTGGNKRRNQRGGVSYHDALNSFKQLVGLPPPSKTYIEGIMELLTKSHESFGTVWSLLSGLGPSKILTSNTFKRANDVVMSRYVYPIGTHQLVHNPQYMEKILFFLQNLSAEEWALIAVAFGTGVSFLVKVYDYILLQRAEKAKAIAIEAKAVATQAAQAAQAAAEAAATQAVATQAAQAAAQDKAQFDAQVAAEVARQVATEVARQVAVEVARYAAAQEVQALEKQENAEADANLVQGAHQVAPDTNLDIGAAVVEQLVKFAEGDGSPQVAAAPSLASANAILKRQVTDIVAAADNWKVDNQNEIENKVIESRKAREIARERIDGDIDLQQGPSKRGKPDAMSPSSAGGNRTMNRRKKSRRSKTIRKKRRLGNPIKKRKQFTKKRKARNKGKRKTRR